MNPARTRQETVEPGRRTLPPWPGYVRTTYSPGPVYVLGLGGAAGLMAVGRPVWALVPLAYFLWKAVLVPAFCALVTPLIHASWVRRVGGSVTWEELRSLVGSDPDAWVILMRPVFTGSRSFGTYSHAGGRSSFLLARRDARACYAIRERDADRAREQGRSIGVEVLEERRDIRKVFGKAAP